jgi:hypothetical protein
MKTLLRFSEPLSDILSPTGLIKRAAAVSVAFGLVHLAGLRPYTSALCGTLETEGPLRYLSALLGLSYVALYILFTVAAPILVLAALISWAWSRRG